MVQQPPAQEQPMAGAPGAGEEQPGAGETGMAGTGEEQPGTAGTQTGMAEGTAGTQAGAGEQMAGQTQTGQAAGAGTGAGTQEGAGGGIKSVYKVVRGDTLWDISGAQYQNPWKWPSIYLENDDAIDDPDLIYPQQNFRIPADPQYTYPEYPEGYVPPRRNR